MIKLWKAIGVTKLDFYCFVIALNKRGLKNVFELHYWQYKIDTASVYKVFCFPARSNQPEVVSSEHLKQKWSLENKQRISTFTSQNSTRLKQDQIGILK